MMANKAYRKPMSVRIGSKILTVHGVLSYIFLYAPIVILLLLSFNDSRFASGTWKGFTLRWYYELFQDEALGAALRNSLYIGIASTFIATVFGTMVSLAMERYQFWGKLTFDGLLYLPIIIPDIAMAVMLLLFFVMVKMPLGRYTIIISHIAFNISFVAVVVRARLAQFDNALEEAAQDLYANRVKAFARVIFPLTLPGVVAGSILVFIPSLGAYVTPDLLGGAKSVMIGNVIYSQFMSARDYPFGAAISFVLMAMMLAGTLIYFRFTVSSQKRGQHDG